jgi:hypothetical protein
MTTESTSVATKRRSIGLRCLFSAEIREVFAEDRADVETMTAFYDC